MTGQKFKEIITDNCRLGFNEIAKMLGITPQGFVSLTNSPDVKSSYIEKAISEIGIGAEQFFPSYQKTENNININSSGENSTVTQNAGSSVSSSDPALLSLVTEMYKQNCKLQDQLIDKLEEYKSKSQSRK